MMNGKNIIQREAHSNRGNLCAMLWGLALLLVEAPVVCLSSPPGFELLLIVSGPLGTNGRKKKTLPPGTSIFSPG